MSTVPINRQRLAPLPTDIAKKLPSNLDAERSVLGAMILNNAGLQKVFPILSTADFFLPQNGLIYAAMLFLAEDARPVDLVTLTEELARSGKIDAAGGAAYLASLVDGVPRASNVEHYAQIVKEKSRLRGLIHLAHKIQSNAMDETGSSEQLLQSAEASFKDLVQVSDENPAVVVGFQAVLKRECAPIEYAIEPLLSKRGTGEIYGWRGTGKS